MSQLNSPPLRKIIHVDMDCFYAAVEVRDNPKLQGKPVAVGGHPDGRGVLTTANYEARKFGVRSAMPVRTALRLCPDLNLVPIHFSKYRNESAKIKSIFKSFTPHIQPLSLDEAYLDVSHCKQFDGSATKIAFAIRKQIFEETRLTASAGIAPNKFLAKVASEWKKPNGQFTITLDSIDGFMLDLPISCIPGVGPKTQERMKAKGFQTCGDLQKLSLDEMHHLFGSWGTGLFDICRGIDHRKVKSHGAAKSISTERTFSKDLKNLNAIEEEFPKVYQDLHQRIENKISKDQIKNIFVKLKFDDFSQTTVENKQFNEMNPAHFQKLLQQGYERHFKPVRLIGLGVRLNAPKAKRSSRQMSLF